VSGQQQFIFDNAKAVEPFRSGLLKWIGNKQICTRNRFVLSGAL
jgi:hypothetical protein